MMVKQTVMIRRFNDGHLAGIYDRSLFQFLGRNDRKVYQMVDSFHGRYQHQNDEPQEYPHSTHRDLYEVPAVEVFFIPKMSEQCCAAFAAMEQVAKKTITNFYDDFHVHDRRMLANNNPTVFGWAVRSTGTHLMIPNNCYSLFLTKHLATNGTDSHEMFLWDGNKLRPSTCEKIEDAICRVGCETFRNFRQSSFHVKNNTQLSSEWQKQIDAELNGRIPNLQNCRKL